MLYEKSKQIGFILQYDTPIDKVYNHDTKIFEQGYVIEEHSVLPAEIDDTIGKNLIQYRIAGNQKTVAAPGQTPPIQVKGVGDLVTSGAHQGEYEVEVVVRDNFINPGAMMLGYEIKNGGIIESESMCVSDFIPVNPHITYMAQGITQYAMEYDEKNNLIGMIILETLNGTRVYTPSAAARFVRVSMFKTNIYTSIFQPHKQNQSYDDFEEPIVIKIYLPRPIYANEYIEFKDGGGTFHQVYQRQEPIDVAIDLPPIPTFKDEVTPNGITTILDVNTTIKPIEFYCKYRSAKHYNPQPLRTGDMQIIYSADDEIIYTRR